ncbi:MAG TPA: hypothetical protein VLL25_14770 [Acidimicrobiales bacterium]|nr:hypothetical protein [Acidimicrobiales bacterium]
MSNGAATATHLMLDDAEIELDGTDLKCFTNHLEISPDVTTQEATTMCGVVEYPGAVKWYLRLTLYQSFDENATFQCLKGALDKFRATGAAAPYKVRAKSQPVSAGNPSFEGLVVPKPFDYLSGDAGALSEVTVEWTMTAEPTVNTSA